LKTTVASAVGAALVAVICPSGAFGQTKAQAVNLTGAQSDYLEHCGGCHGLQGDSSPAPIPVLRDRVGYFMCSGAGRRYLLHLPNVDRADVDDGRLADMMNFVVFDLGGHSTPSGVQAFGEAEVKAERGKTMTGSEVMDQRKRVVEDLIQRCKSPVSLRESYPGEQVRLRR
jgi:hypothetical protein